MKIQTSMVLLCTVLSGCTTAPSINVLGAYFPGWMFCIVGAIAVTSILHLILRGRGLLGVQGRGVLPIAYSALTVALALVGWILFFKN